MATQVEIEKRVTQIFQWMLEPLSRTEILQKGSEMWGVSERQIDEYSSRSTKLIHDLVQKERPYKLHEIIKKLDLIYEKAMHQGVAKRTRDGYSVVYVADMQVARQALMDQAKLLGMVVDKIQPIGEGAFDDWDTKDLEEHATH